MTKLNPASSRKVWLASEGRGGLANMGSLPSMASSHSSRSSSDRAWKVCTTPGLSSGIRSKQNLLSMDSEIRLMQAFTRKVSLESTFGAVWLYGIMQNSLANKQTNKSETSMDKHSTLLLLLVLLLLVLLLVLLLLLLLLTPVLDGPTDVEVQLGHPEDKDDVLQLKDLKQIVLLS